MSLEEEVLTMFYDEFLTVEEIAKALGQDIRVVKSIVSNF